MDPKAIQGWTPCETKEFKALVPKISNHRPCDRMEVLAARFPEKTMQQLSDKFVEMFAEMLSEMDGQPSNDDATNGFLDWYKLLEGDTHDSNLGPSVETPLNQPSKQRAINTEDDQEAFQKPYCKSTQKRRQFWSDKEHRQFLLGIECFGRGEWKAISQFFLPSRTPAQLASHAQKFFMREKQNEMHNKRQRHSINDVKLVGHNLKDTVHHYTTLGRTESKISSILPHDLTQGMPYFGHPSKNTTNLARLMAPTKQTALRSMQACGSSSTASGRGQENFLLGLTQGIRAANRTLPACSKHLGGPTDQRDKNKGRILPGVLAAPTPQDILYYGQRSNSTTNLHPTMPQF